MLLASVARRTARIQEVTMCFIHSGSTGNSGLVQRAVLGEAAAAAFSGAAAGAWSMGSMDVAGSGSPDAVTGPAGAAVLDGFSRVLHNRWNRDLPPAAVVRPGEVIQLLCRDALDIGEADRKSTRLNSSHSSISYAVFCLKKKK